MRRTLASILSLAAVGTTLAFAPVPTGPDGVLTGAAELPAGCVDDQDATYPFEVSVAGETALGAIAFPDRTTPRGVVVFAHGYGHSSASWLAHMRWAANELGVVAVAMDYRGTTDLPAPGAMGGTRGWQVREGADDSNAAAIAILTACPAIPEVSLFSVSMGTNAAGLALAAKPTRPDSGTPLYDWWFNVEGAANVVETYHEARSLAASGNVFANNAVADIERENGGAFEDNPEAYFDLAVVTHAAEIADSGVKGVWSLHGLEDGLVPYDQARELHAALADQGVKQHFFTALRRSTEGAAEDMTNLTGYAVGPVSPGYDSLFVGHGSESSAKNDVMRFSLARLKALVVDRDLLLTCREGTLDAGAYSSVTHPCP